MTNDKKKSNEEEHYSNTVVKYCTKPKNIGKISNPDGAAYVRGLCGDSIGIYLIMHNDTISEAKFSTDGCGATIACGEAATIIAKGKNFKEILEISPADIIKHLEWLPEINIHCAILVTNTLHKALASYLLMKELK